jgi:GTP-binding protein HflX
MAEPYTRSKTSQRLTLTNRLHDVSDGHPETALLVGIRHAARPRLQAEAELAELCQLARAAELEIGSQLLAPVARIDPAWYVGRGKAAEIGREAQRCRAQVVIFDEALSPAQVRNLEQKFDRKVIDRGNLVLDIFARRARTREAITQVELAQLEYLLPRLTGLWAHFSRQVGGVGTKGPGETQLEVDRRQTRTRIAQLKKELGKIAKTRVLQRTHRHRHVRMCALVGYTNAGKSTLFNRLARAQVAAEDRMFSSLDAKSKRIHLHEDGDSRSPQTVLVDTVGFVSKLPPQLVASFRSTLEELRYADLLLCVVDLAHPDAAAHIGEVLAVAAELGASDIPRLWVLNKSDLTAPERVSELARGLHPNPYLVCSARTGQGTDALLRSIRDRLATVPPPPRD